MSNRIFKRTGRAGIALAVGCAFAAVPAAAQAAPVNLATVEPVRRPRRLDRHEHRSVGAQRRSRRRPRDRAHRLRPPAVVNGATHANDGVAQQAKADLTNAYNVAAGQAVLPANDLTGSNLGNRTLPAGAYRYTSSAGLTGVLTLDGAG